MSRLRTILSLLMGLSPTTGGWAQPRSDEAREKAREALLGDVAQGWQQPPAPIPAPPAVTALVAPLEKKLNEIVLPNITFTRAEITQVVAALAAAAEESDTSDALPKGVNIVLLDPANRRPAVSLALRNASLKRVLDFVTQSIGYRYDVQPDAVVIRAAGEAGELETDFFPVSRATVLRMIGGTAEPNARDGRAGARPELAGPAEAGAIRNFLEQAGVSFRGDGAALAYDGSALIITQTPRNLERIRNLLARYTATRQVEIEAKFMEVQEGALEELGVQWNVSRRGVPQIDPATGNPVLDANGRQVFRPQETYSTGGVNRALVGAFPTSNTTPAITIDSAGIPPTMVDGVTTPGIAAESRVIPIAPPTLPGSVSLGAAAGALGVVSGFVGEFDVSAVIRALAQQQGTDLLSSPRITVLSGNTASITVAQEMRYPQSYGEMQSQVGSGSGTGTGISAAGVTITSGTPQEFATRNVGVELKVTPTVEEDERAISLDLNPKVTEFEGFVEYGGPSIAISSGVTVKVPPGFYQPIFSVRDISTRVTIWDGATLVMGGLTREEVKRVDDKVPLLGDIPLVGRLFRSKGESAQKRNLLIFVTANLVTPGGARKRTQP
jgi:general secretion pathway protein D